MGTILSTIDLIANRTLPGAAGVSPELYPQYGLYDSANGQIFLRNSYDTETAIGVLSTTSGQMVADISTPGGSSEGVITTTIADDSKTGFLYATNPNTGYYPGNVSIIDPATDQVTGSITVGYDPNGIVYDPVNNELYVANEGTHNVTVISGADNRTVANISTESQPSAILFDPISNEVFVADHVSPGYVTVISTTSNTAIANISVGTSPFALALDTQDDYVDVLNQSTDGYDGLVTEIHAGSSPSVTGTLTVGLEPYALAYDPINDQVYVANSASIAYDNVSVFNQSTGQAVASVPISFGPADESIVFDPVGADMFVSSAYANNVTIINTTTDKVLGSVSTFRLGGLGPQGLVVDPATGNVYSLNAGDDLTAPTSTVVSPASHTAIDTISLATYPRGFTYEAAGNYLVVGNAGGNNTYYLNASTYAVTHETPAGRNPEFTAYDGTTGTTYTLNPASDNVTATNAAGQTIASIPIGVGGEVQSMVFNSFDGDLYLPSETGNVTVINGTTNTHLAPILLHAMDPWGSAYDSHNHDVYVANYESHNVSVIDSTDVVVRSIPVGNNPISVAFDSENDTIWVANAGSANLTVINDTSQLQVWSVPIATTPNALDYDPANNAVYNDPGYPYEVVAYNASTYVELAGSPLVYTTVPNTLGSMGYDPATHDLLVADLTSGAIYVIGAPPAPKYPVSFVETGLLTPFSWSVTLNGTVGGSTTNTIAFSETNGTSYPYTVSAVAGYTVNVTGGTLSVAGQPVTVRIKFTAPSTPESFPVYFIASGLAPSTNWSVTLNGTQASSKTDSIAFTALNGTIPYTVASVTGYTCNRTSGGVVVNGSPATVDVGFTAIAGYYVVTFVEADLPPTTLWSVTLGGQLASSSATTIPFNEENGTYPFTVSPISGYTATPSSGSVIVDGAAKMQSIDFAAVASLLSVTLTATPATVDVGSSTTFTATVAGGSAPFSFTYTGLPSGCASTASSFDCQPAAAGVFTVTVTAADSAGQKAEANATLTVNSLSSGPSNQTTTSSSAWIYVLVVVVVAAILILIVAYRRRKKKPETGPPSSEPASPRP
jgi:YVTN family beta-propeller protein